ncbi:hydrolase [Dulcicalothrix desertica PCC 7102]|uniref:Hydrolase n=1 Tax=Dulcicalothrix desertica PCC 7102 TaxID=232991 RepID=A0A3S1C7S3_9CYAN|nr:HAD family phosphatase [Dulcicalothrix desertica]RUT01864.1 hydrolase [Dulcicalothrix desertica PCC 7102]TWH43016.1 beta-phosphoglucomutase [Dulcicalothrix desertica PCC 7102]
MLAALLFDLDGTLVNTDPIHFLAWQKMLSRYDIHIDESFYQKNISGRLNPEILADILPQLSPHQAVGFADEKEAMFREMAPSLQRLPGLTELLAWTDTHNIKRTLVTNAPRANAYFMLDVLGLGTAFELIVLAEDEEKAKPDPTPYRVAAQRLGVNIENAIALEDSPSGIRSAVGAGIKTIGIASTHDPEKLCEIGACMAISDFTDLRLWTLLNFQLNSQLLEAAPIT